MKKRKNIILSAITCFVSICLLMIGVYSASNPGVSISGQVSYTARDASVLVQGKTSNDGTEITFTKSAPENKTALLALSKATDKINQSATGDTPAEYFDWTQGEQSGNSSETNESLSAWNVGTVSFKESSTGIQSIKVKFVFTNYSNYPVTATLTFDKTLDEMATANVTRTSDEQDKVITKDLGVAGSADASATVEITYAVKDDSKSVDATGLLGMNITLEKTQQKAQLEFDLIGGTSSYPHFEYSVTIKSDEKFIVESQDTNKATFKLAMNSKVEVVISCYEDMGPAIYDWWYKIYDNSGAEMDTTKYTASNKIVEKTTSNSTTEYTFVFENFEGAKIQMNNSSNT